MCHLVFFAPLLALPLFWFLPFSVALPIFGGVLAVTALIAWPVVAAWRRPHVTGAEGMLGAKGEAITELNPHGLIRCQGEVWSATADEPIPAGERVRVIAVNRLHAQVERHVRTDGQIRCASSKAHQASQDAGREPKSSEAGSPEGR